MVAQLGRDLRVDLDAPVQARSRRHAPAAQPKTMRPSGVVRK